MRERLLRLAQVKEQTGLCRSAIYAEMSAGRFPRSITLGQRTVAWIESEVEAWVSERISAARARWRWCWRSVRACMRC